MKELCRLRNRRVMSWLNQDANVHVYRLYGGRGRKFQMRCVSHMNIAPMDGDMVKYLSPRFFFSDKALRSSSSVAIGALYFRSSNVGSTLCVGPGTLSTVDVPKQLREILSACTVHYSTPINSKTPAVGLNGASTVKISPPPQLLLFKPTSSAPSK